MYFNYFCSVRLIKRKTLMRKVSFILTVLLFITAMHAQDLKKIQLNNPDKNRGSSVMKALSDRRSDREYANKELSLQDLSDLLWAANGINRPDGKRTAPSALNKQDIDIYVILLSQCSSKNPINSPTLAPVCQKAKYMKLIVWMALPYLIH